MKSLLNRFVWRRYWCVYLFLCCHHFALGTTNDFFKKPLADSSDISFVYDFGISSRLFSKSIKRDDRSLGADLNMGLLRSMNDNISLGMVGSLGLMAYEGDVQLQIGIKPRIQYTFSEMNSIDFTAGYLFLVPENNELQRYGSFTAEFGYLYKRAFGIYTKLDFINRKELPKEVNLNLGLRSHGKAGIIVSGVIVGGLILVVMAAIRGSM